MSKLKENPHGGYLGIGTGEKQQLQTLKDIALLKQWVSGNPEKVNKAKDIVTISLDGIKDASSTVAGALTASVSGAVQKVKDEAAKTRFKSFMPRVLSNLLKNINSAIKLTWERSGVLMREHPSFKYAGLAFLGATVCLMLYKVVKWVRGTKKEEQVSELQTNIFTFNKKLKEGFEFTKNLNKILKEAENSESAMLSTIQRSKTAAEECGLFAIEAEEKKEGASLIKKIAYTVLGGVAALAAGLALYGYYSATPVEGKDWKLPTL